MNYEKEFGSLLNECRRMYNDMMNESSNVISIKEYAEDKELRSCARRYMQKIENNISKIADLLPDVDALTAYKIATGLESGTEIALIALEKKKSDVCI